jgi:hypothetical protein
MRSHLIGIRRDRKKAKEGFARRIVMAPDQDFTMLGAF